MACGCIAPAVGKHGERRPWSACALVFRFHSGLQQWGWCCPYSGWISLLSYTSLEAPQRRTSKCFLGLERWWLRSKEHCSYREPGFNTQHLHGGSQASIIPVPGIQHPLLTSSGIRYACGTRNTCKQALININKEIKEI